MKKLLFLLTYVSFSFATLIKLPDAKILTERLSEKGFKHFIEKTDIIQKLADEERTIFEINEIVENALTYYCSRHMGPGMAKPMLMKDEVIFELIFQDDPESLKKIKKTII